MDKFDDSVMIALLPMSTDWCYIDLPHMTLVYAGLKDDLPQDVFNELGKDAASIAMLSPPITLKTMQIEVFGDDEKVDVIRLQPSSELLAMRRSVESWNASEHPFRPHVTIGPSRMHTVDPPMYIAFDRIMVCWGDENMTFWLKR